MSAMKQTILLVFICLSFATALAQEPAAPAAVEVESSNWINAAPAAAGFTVQMPGKSAEQSQPVAGHTGVENHLFTIETNLAAYVVSYVQFTDEVTDPVAIKALLDRGRDGGLEASNAQLKGEKEIMISGHPGREWLMTLPGDLSATARAYWVKDRLYQIVFIAKVAAAESPEVSKLREGARARFFDSFRLSGDTR
jgi:hypothetical protein